MDGDAGVQFLVLGSLEVRTGQRLVALGGAKPRLVLAVLLVHANTVVSADRLIDVLWGDAPPDSALSTVQKHVHRLRAAIDPGRAGADPSGRLVTRAPGYLLRVEPDECDASRFERAVADARRLAAGGALEQAAAGFGQALGLWRGPALAEFADGDFARAEVARLDNVRAVAMEERVEVLLSAGRHAEVIGELEATTAAYPLRETPRAQLMLALYRCGRQAEALRAYEQFRRYLGEEVGLEPSAALVQLADAMVVQKPELSPEPSRDAPARAPAAAGTGRPSGEEQPMVAPSGTVTFLFTDIEGSTRLWDTAPDAMRAALEGHDAILRGAIARHGGVVFSTGGDGFGAAFARAADGLAAATDAQVELASASWPPEAAIRVRMGLHTGEVVERDGDYFGPPVNQAARLMALAHGGQVLCSAVTAGLLGGEATLLDLGEHLLPDLSRREHVFQVEAPGLDSDFPPLRSVDVMPGNLPVQPTSFVGRSDEVGDLSAALGRAPLVTVTGVGGVGKTRLAVQVAAELLPTFADGAWLCELAAAGDADTLAQVVASTLGVAQRAGRSLERSIVEFLRPSRLLLVLDNCEHLLEASGRLAAAILAGCPGVRVLATSREALAVAGEQVWPLRSLELPDPAGGLAAAATSGSGRLFCERAAGARPDFALSEANAAAVVELCRRLDGIPLAIELAAARVAALTPAEIAGRLDERFRLLTGGRRTAVERHQTLRAAVDWSYGLLSETERVVFDRLAVFSGGFTLAAATAVVTGEGVEGWDVLDALGGLVAKSMVVAEPGAGEYTRYQLLETLRQYGRERLDEDGSTDRWQRRHARHFAAFAAEVARGLRGRDEVAWRERLLGDLDNLRSAVLWGLDTGVEEDQQTAVAIVAWLAYESQTLATGIGRWAEQALPAVQRSTSGFRTAVLGAAAVAAFYRGDLDASERHARAAVEGGYRPDDPSPCLASFYLALILTYQGRREDAARHLDAAEKAIVGRENEDYLRSWVQSVRVSISQFADDKDEEIAHGRLGMSLAQRTGNPTILALASYALGWALRHRHPDESLAAFDRCVALARRGASTMTLATALCYGAQAAASLGDADGARARLSDALEESVRNDDWTVLTHSLDAAVDIFCYRGEARAAAVLAGAVETSLAPLRFPYIASRGPGLAVRTANLARAREELGDSCYQQARADGVAMSRQDALAFTLQHL